MRFRSLGLVVAALVPSLASAGMEVWIDGQPATPHVSALPEVAGAELAPPREVTFGNRTYQHSEQRYGGVPIVGCGVDKVLDETGAVIQVGGQVCAASSAAPFVVDPAQAASSAQSAIEALGKHERVIVATPVAEYRTQPGGALAPTWAVDVATVNPWGVWRVFVSGGTGQVVRVNDLAMKASGRGLVFTTAKGVLKDRAAMRPLGGLGGDGLLHGDVVMVDDLTDFLSSCPDTELFCVPPKAETCAAMAHGHTFAYSPRETTTFGTCTTADRFDQVTGYFQMSQMVDYFSQQVGWQPGSNVLKPYMPLPVLANVPLFINAFFAPPSDQWRAFFAFGDEFDPPRIQDFLRDPTVPRHEFTHSMVFDSGSAVNDIFDCVSECTEYPRALHEALADYFSIASLNAKTTVVGAALGTDLAGANAEVSVARDLVNDFRFPCDLVGEPHSDGRIWSAFLLEVRKLVGRQADSVIFHSLLDLPHVGNLQFGHALAALAADLPPLPESKTVSIVESAVRKGLIGPSAYDRGVDVEIDAAEQLWDCAAGVACGQLKDGLQQEGSAAAAIGIPDGFGPGLAAWDPAAANADGTPINVDDKPFVEAFIKVDRDIQAGELALVLADTPDCSSPLAVLAIPAVATPAWQTVDIPLDHNVDNITCVGLAVLVDNGAVIVDLDDIRGVAPIRYGSVVLPVQAGPRLEFQNRFPLPAGDAHFYYFRRPVGATTVTVMAKAAHGIKLNTALHFCGDVSATGDGVFAAELDNVFLWAYDKSQTMGGFTGQLTPLPIDQHILLTGVPATGTTKRKLVRFPLPSSPSGIYAVSLQGTGDYSVKLGFE